MSNVQVFGGSNWGNNGIHGAVEDGCGCGRRFEGKEQEFYFGHNTSETFVTCQVEMSG